MNFIYDENGKQKIINMFGYCFGDTPLPISNTQDEDLRCKKEKKILRKKVVKQTGNNIIPKRKSLFFSCNKMFENLEYIIRK